MAEYTVGRATTHKRKRTTYNVHLTVNPRVYARLEAMRDALQREIGPAHDITVASVVRRILYMHPSLKKLAHRHFSPESEDGGDSLVM